MGFINVDPECIIIYWFIIFNVTTSFSSYIRKMNIYGERHNGIEEKKRKLGIVSIELPWLKSVIVVFLSAIDTQGSWATMHDSLYLLSVFFWEVRCNDNFYPKGDHLLIRCLVYRAVYVWDKNDDVIKRKHFPRYWPFVRGIHRSPVNSPHKVQWRGALMFSLICAWRNGWVNNGEAGNLRRHRTIMTSP